MGNEIYGTVTIDISVPTIEEKEEMALLSENYRYNPHLQKNVRLIMEDYNGIIREIKIHNFDLELNRFFSDEY